MANSWALELAECEVEGDRWEGVGMKTSRDKAIGIYARHELITELPIRRRSQRPSYDTGHIVWETSSNFPRRNAAGGKVM